MKYDVIFVGGGLANGLAAARLVTRHPQKRILVIERGSTLGGQHTWCFHHRDVSANDHEWLQTFVSKSWPGYEVRFPLHQRKLSTAYYAIRSTDFHCCLSKILGPSRIVYGNAVELKTDQVVLSDGCVLDAELVLDGRGWQSQPSYELGWQKFVGQTLQLSKPHGLTEPVLMDVTCEQIDGFRFFYLLPWSKDTLLIEDTRYSDSPKIDRQEFVKEIHAYCDRQQWSVQKVEYEEVGALAIPLTSQLPEVSEALVGVGTRAGLFHPTTGYSLPLAVRFANQLADQFDKPSSQLKVALRYWNEQTWKGLSFFLLLNRMLFYGCAPSQRYRVLQRFYRLPVGLIERFYASQLKWKDIFRIFWGRPPISVWQALKCFPERRWAST